MTIKTARIYSLVRPVPERFDDKGEPPLTSLPVERATGKTWEAAILGTPNTIEAVRITIPDCANETIEPEDFRAFIRLRIFILDCIRIGYDSSAESFRQGDRIFALWNFLDPNKPPNFSVITKEPLNHDYRVNALGLAHLISAPPNFRPLIHLLADSADTRLPLQFRFLSLYKIIEMHYRVTTNKNFTQFAEPFVSDFRAIYPQVVDLPSLCHQLSVLRNRCAHIKLTTGELGYSHLQAETADLPEAHEILRRMAVRTITSNYPDSPLRFAESPEQAAVQFAEMEAAGLKPIKVAGS